MILGFLLFWSLAYSQSQPSKGSVLTQTVGTSAFQVVTSREVRASSLLGQAMKSDLQNVLVETTADDVNATLFEVAIFRESQSLNAVKLQPEEIDRIFSQVKSRLQGRKEWKKLEVQDQELRQWIERKRVAEVFLELKSNSLTSIVTDQEIQDYYERNRVKFGSTPLEDQRENIRRFLQKENQKQRVQDWLTALKTKYQVRNDIAEDVGTLLSPSSPSGKPSGPSQNEVDLDSKTAD